jgi:hypothetical protein
LKKAAAICERPALWTQAKMTVFIERAPGDRRTSIYRASCRHVEMT